MYKNKYYDYVLKYQSVLIILITIYINQFQFWTLGDYYNFKDQARPLYIISLICIIFLFITRHQMDNIIRNSWMYYDIVLLFVVINDIATLRTIFSNTSNRTVDFGRIFASLKVLFTTGRIWIMDARYIRDVIYLGISFSFVLFLFISIIWNHIYFYKVRNKFEN